MELKVPLSLLNTHTLVRTNKYTWKQSAQVLIFPQTMAIMPPDSECLVTFQIYFQSFRAGSMEDSGAF